MGDLIHVSLFSGIGGIDLASEWAGFETVLQVEKDEFCQQILTKQWPDVPRMEDVRDVTAESVRQTVGERGIRPTLVSGGFPCQPFSSAGKRLGQKDDRDLWPQMFRIIQELRPDWILGENVANFTNMGLDRTISDLEGEGYTVRPFEIPAVAVQAPHQRMRVFIVANAERSGSEERNLSEITNRPGSRGWRSDAPNPPYSPGKRNNGDGIERRNIRTREMQPGGRSGEASEGKWQLSESPVCGADDGIPDRVDRLKALGNAVVPQQVYGILRGIAEIDRHIDSE